jgi:hypothetical protein
MYAVDEAHSDGRAAALHALSAQEPPRPASDGPHPVLAVSAGHGALEPRQLGRARKLRHSLHVRVHSARTTIS